MIVEVPDISNWREALESEEAAEAMKYDGVRSQTILALVEGVVPPLSRKEAQTLKSAALDEEQHSGARRSVAQ